MNEREALIDHFGELLPLGVRWAAEEEKRILREGMSLPVQSLKDAQALGVREPDRVRWLSAESVPRPQGHILKAACDAIHFLGPETQGLTLGYGIFIRRDRVGVRDLLAHELVHVAQYERMGGIEPFLRQYLMECLTVGYESSPLEQEAIFQSGQLG